MMDNYYVSKLIPLIAESEINVIPNPLTNIAVCGTNKGSYPKWRGITRVPELMAAGINVAFGQDCVMDPWYAYGSADMLEVAHMGSHLTIMFGLDQVRACFDAITENPAKSSTSKAMDWSPVATPIWCCYRRPTRWRQFG